MASKVWWFHKDADGNGHNLTDEEAAMLESLHLDAETWGNLMSRGDAGCIDVDLPGVHVTVGMHFETNIVDAMELGQRARDFVDAEWDAGWDDEYQFAEFRISTTVEDLEALWKKKQLQEEGV